MKRDLDLVRRILCEVADSCGPLPASAFAGPSCPIDLVEYHFRLMKGAGLMEIEEFSDFTGTEYRAIELTWEGQDFLAAVKPDRIWDKVKMKIAKLAGDAPFSVVRELAVSIAATALLG